MFIMDIRNVDTNMSQEHAISRISVTGPRVSAILWGALDETIITGHEDGEITLWDVRVGPHPSIVIYIFTIFSYVITYTLH